MLMRFSYLHLQQYRSWLSGKVVSQISSKAFFVTLLCSKRLFHLFFFLRGGTTKQPLRWTFSAAIEERRSKSMLLDQLRNQYPLVLWCIPFYYSLSWIIFFNTLKCLLRDHHFIAQKMGLCIQWVLGYYWNYLLFVLNIFNNFSESFVVYIFKFRFVINCQ